MDTLKIISAAQANARRAREQGASAVRLPVMSFESYSIIFARSDLSAREMHRAQQKRTYYFKRFLEELGIGVTMITVLPQEVIAWADENDHDMFDDRERTHVLAHFVNQPDIPPARCVHKRPLPPDLASAGIELFATLTTYGETPDTPEILSAVVHTRDGWVVESVEALAVDHGPEEAFDLARELLAKHMVRSAFHDPEVRRPTFCPDCGELLLNVAGEMEYSQLEKDGPPN